jgi:uncharacterized protein YfaS (alpha-2-macroglobulin family)
MRKKTNPLLLLFIIGLLVSQACDLPFSEEPAPTLAPTGTAASVVSQPTDAALPTEVPPEPLPPAIVEILPLPGSTLHLSDGITLYFNQSMDRDSVEAAMQFDPHVSVQFDWLSDDTLLINHEEQLPVSSQFTFTIGASASSTSGLSLIETYSLTYQTAKGLQVVERLPRPDGRDVNPGAALAVTFNNPVVPLSAESIEHAPAFTLEPAASGRGEWLNTSTFIFYPDPPLFGGMEYLLKLNTNLVSTSGAPLIFENDAPSEWSFTTAPPLLISIVPPDAVNLPLDSAFNLTFNQPMDRESVGENLTLQDSMGGSVSGGFTWNEDSSELTFQPDSLLSRGTNYYLNLSGQTKALGGTPLEEDYSFGFASVGSLAVEETVPDLAESLGIPSGMTGIRIRFNAPIAEGDMSELVSIEPKIGNASAYKVSEKSIMITGYLSASTDYTLAVSADVMDRWGEALGEPYIVSFSTDPASPSLTIPMLQMGSTALFLTPDDTSIPANVTNLDSVNVESYELTLTDYIELSDSRELMSDFANPSASFWQQPLSLSKDVNEPVDIRVTPQNEPLETGLYLYRLDSSQLDKPAKKFLLVVSRIHLVIKRSADELFIWAVDLETNKPMPDTVLTIHYENAAMLSNCMTDASGTCRIDLPDFIETYDSLYVVTGDPGTSNFGFAEDTWSAGILGWDFGFYTRMTKEKLMGYMYTDRPIYRPGQTVNFRVIIRDAENARYTIPDLDKVLVEVIGTYSLEVGESPLLAEIAIPLSEYGSGSASYTLPEDAPLGYYTLHIEEIDDIWLDFQVAEYRKPEIDLQVSFSSQDYLIGQDVQATVQADYYFGAPAGEMDVHWVLFTKPDYLYLPFGYQVGAHSLDWFDRGYWMPAFSSLGNYVLEGNGQTDLDGSIVIDLPFDELADEVDLQNIEQLTLEVTIRDQSELPVSARATASLHPDEFYIGLRPESWTAQAGAELGYSVQTVDWDRNIFADQALSASFQKVIWELDRGAVQGIGYPQYLLSFTDISSASFVTDEYGQARLVFIPPEPGTYLLEVRHGGAVTQVMSWVGGQGSVAWPNLPNQQLPVTAEADAYRPGQTVLIFIPNPFEDDVLALVTVERSQVMRKYVFPISGSNYEFPISLTDDDAPNVYISVTLLGNNADGRPDFRLGYLDLDVEPEAQTLKVNMEASPQRSEPGEEVLFSIQVTDHQDNPVQGEFSLALVDKAVLALADPNAPEILEAFFGLQPFGIRNSFSLAVYAERILSVSAEGLGGGGGGPDEAPFIRDDFKDTAFWSGTIETDSDGRAEVRVQLPDNLTTWVANLRGLTKDTLVGETEGEVITTKDLLVRPVVPRFLVEGDHVELAAIVHNNTGQSVNVEVSLQALGFILDNDDDTLQRVTIPAGGQERVSWWGEVQTGEDVELIFTAEAGDLQDATRPERGDLPVLSYSYPQTFGTSGVLTEGGDWLEVINLPRTFLLNRFFHACCQMLKHSVYSRIWVWNPPRLRAI